MLGSHLQYRQSRLSRACIINCNNSNEIDNVANTSITFCKVSIRMVVLSYQPKVDTWKLLKRWNGDNIHGCIYCHQWHRKREIERTFILSKYPRNTHNFWASPNVPLTPISSTNTLKSVYPNKTVPPKTDILERKQIISRPPSGTRTDSPKISGYNALTR